MATKKKVKSAGRNPVGLHVVQGATRETVNATVAGIVTIIKDSRDSAVLIKALDVLDHATATKPLTISNCNFQMGA